MESSTSPGENWEFPMNKSLKALILVVSGILIIYPSFLWLERVHQVKKQHIPQPRYEAWRKLPPELIFTTTLLGGFRGIIVDILWLRSMKLKEEGKFFELVQLSKWIGLLQPDIPYVWTFNAWNLAYNVSVEFPTGEERWNWIYLGIKLLRDKALVYCPTGADIYKELSWIYLNKIGGTIDEFSAFYKQKWAQIMDDALGGANVEDLAKIIEEKGEEKKFKEILGKLREEGINPLLNPEILKSEEVKKRIPESLRKDFHLWIRAKYLKETLKLDPKIMKELNEKFVPFDWRVPGPHAIYWVYLGHKKADLDEVTYKRFTYYAMNNILKWGRVRISYLPAGKVFLINPNFAVVPILNNFYEETIKSLEKHLKTPTQASHANFLKDVILNAFIYNDLKTAHKYFKYLKDHYPEEVGHRNFEEFILHEYSYILREGSIQEIRSLLFGILYQYYWSLAVGEDDRAYGLDHLAHLLHKKIKSFGKFRDVIPEYDELKEFVLSRVYQTFPSALVESLKIRLKKFPEEKK